MIIRGHKICPLTGWGCSSAAWWCVPIHRQSWSSLETGKKMMLAHQTLQQPKKEKQ